MSFPELGKPGVRRLSPQKEWAGEIPDLGNGVCKSTNVKKHDCWKVVIDHWHLVFSQKIVSDEAYNLKNVYSVLRQSGSLRECKQRVTYVD